MAFKPAPREKPTYTGTLDWVIFGALRQYYFQLIAVGGFALIGSPVILATAVGTFYGLDYAWFSLVALGIVFSFRAGMFLRNYTLQINWNELRPDFERDHRGAANGPTRTTVIWVLVLLTSGMSVFLTLAVVLGELAGHYLGGIGVVGAILLLGIVETWLNSAEKSFAFIGVNSLQWLLKTLGSLSGRSLSHMSIVGDMVLLLFQSGLLGISAQLPGQSQWTSE